MSDLDLDEEGGPGRPGAPVDTGRLSQDLLRRWRLVPVIAAVATVIGVIYAQQTVSALYRAQTVMLYEGTKAREELITLVDSIKLPTNLEEVRKRVKGLPPLDKLNETTLIEFDPASRLVVVRSEADGSKKVADLSNTVVDVFLEYQSSVARTQLQERLRLVESDIEAARVRVENARQQYAAFNQSVGVEDLAVERQLLQDEMVKTEQQIIEADKTMANEKARATQMKASLKGMPRSVSGGTSIANPDSAELASAMQEVARLEARFSADHPKLLAAKAKVARLRTSAASGVNVVRSVNSMLPNPEYATVAAGAKAAATLSKVAAERKKSLLDLKGKLKPRFDALSRRMGEATQLQQSISLAEKRRDELQAEQLKLREALTNPGERFRVVTPAVPPPKPDEVVKAKTAVLFPVGAIMLTVLGMVAYSLRGLRVHTAREAAFWANTPVVASSTWPRDQENMAALVDELSDAAPRALGTTLVVAARPNEVPLAREVAYWLGSMTQVRQKALIGADAGPSGRVVPSHAPDEQPVIELGPGAEPTPSAGPTSIGSTALVRSDVLDPRDTGPVTLAQAWDGPTHGPALRRAARHADRVLVVVASATMSVADLAQLRTRLGRGEGIGLLLVGLDPALERLPDRVGEVDAFWAFHGATIAA